MATKAAVAGTPLRSIPARRAGSPPIRSGVSAHAASPKAFSTKESQKPIRWPSPCTIHWMRQARATRSIATSATQITLAWRMDITRCRAHGARCREGRRTGSGNGGSASGPTWRRDRGRCADARSPVDGRRPEDTGRAAGGSSASGHGHRPPRPHRRPGTPPHRRRGEAAVGRVETDRPRVFTEPEPGVPHRRVSRLTGEPTGRDEAHGLEAERAERGEASIDALASGGLTQCTKLTPRVSLPMQHDLRAVRRTLPEPPHEVRMPRERPFPVPVGDHQQRRRRCRARRTSPTGAARPPRAPE